MRGTWWTYQLELAAEAVEVGHAQLRAALLVAGVKARAVPKPLVIPRPTDEPVEQPSSATFDDWARALNGE